MKRKELKEEIVDFVEYELSIAFGDDVQFSDFLDEYPQRDELVEAFKNACESGYSVTVPDSALQSAETIQDVLDECIDAVLSEEE